MYFDLCLQFYIQIFCAPYLSGPQTLLAASCSSILVLEIHSRLAVDQLVCSNIAKCLEILDLVTMETK